MTPKKTNRRVRGKKFRFPKGIYNVHHPSMSPIGFDDLARQTMKRVIESYSSFPKNTSAYFSYRYYPETACGITEVTIYKLPKSHLK